MIVFYFGNVVFSKHTLDHSLSIYLLIESCYLSGNMALTSQIDFGV